MRIDLINKLIKNYTYRGYVTSILSVLVTIAFLLYNLIIGIVYKLAWNFSVIFYYIILIIIRLIILLSERKWKNVDLQKLKCKRIKLFKIENIFLLILDFALIVPIYLMVLQKRSVNIGMIPTIAIAAYTTYIITISCINYHKTKKMDNLSLHGLKIINLKEAIVSILTLQNTMIMVIGSDESMFYLTAISSICILLSLIFISVFQVKKISNI